MAPVRRMVLAAALVVAATAHAAIASASEPEAAQAHVAVRTYGELVAALQPANSGRRILVARGDYPVDRPLQVPDGATLEGEGVMRRGADGIPEGFEPGTETVLRVVAGFQGQVLTLGDGSVVRGLRLLDLENPASQPARRRGNVVYLASRAPGDVIAASVVDCEVVSPHVPGFSDRGPEGHGIAVLTQNPNLGAPPAPHEGARVELVVRRSLVRTHRGAAVLAANFAARGDITMTLDGNRMEGGLVLAAGVSRPDLVAGARLRVGSHGNLYRPSGRVDFGWRLFGGSSSPHHPQAGVPGATRSLLRLDSTGDRIEGFRWAIQAAAARRLGPDSAMLTDNRVELDLRGTRIRSDGEGAADLVLRGTLSEVAQFQDRGEFAAGDRNVLQVMMSGVRGSGPRSNVYEDVVGPRQPQDPGTGNRLWFLGGREAFLRSNRDVDPAPSARYFADESSGASATRD